MTYEEIIETITRNIQLCLGEMLVMTAECMQLTKTGEMAAAQRAARSIETNLQALGSLIRGLDAHIQHGRMNRQAGGDDATVGLLN